MRLGMMLTDGDEPRTGGPLTFAESYQRPGGISLPYLRSGGGEEMIAPTWTEGTNSPTGWNVFISRVDPNTGEVYETSGPLPPTTNVPLTQINHLDDAPPQTKPLITPLPGQPDGDFTDTRAPEPPQQSLTKPLLIAGAIVAGLFLLRD